VVAVFPGEVATSHAMGATSLPAEAAPSRPAEAAPSRPAEAAARRAEPEAFEAAVGPLWPGLVRRLVLVLGDRAAAEDVAQDAYLRAFRSWGRFDGPDVRAWLYTIALRLAFNERRRHRRWLAAVRRVEPRPGAGPSDPDLWAALGRLDLRTRTALLLNAVDGYSQREIAEMLAVPEGTVASWLSRGRAALRVDLGGNRDR
jgi:RNA polymerase sigma-70 factor (ECF subfamily)